MMLVNIVYKSDHLLMGFCIISKVPLSFAMVHICFSHDNFNWSSVQNFKFSLQGASLEMILMSPRNRLR